LQHWLIFSHHLLVLFRPNQPPSGVQYRLVWWRTLLLIVMLFCFSYVCFSQSWYLPVRLQHMKKATMWSLYQNQSRLTLKSRYRLYVLIMAELEFSNLICFEECTTVWGLHNYTSEIFYRWLEHICSCVICKYILCSVYMIMKDKK
jgi:hypothetical protein